MKKYKNDHNCRLHPNYKHSLVFTPEQEKSIADYLVACSQMFHGLTPQKTRQLAFEMAVVNKMKMPQQWLENRVAGEDWMTSFLKRHPTLSIRSPEATSLARATAFNRSTTSAFFDIIEKVIKEHNIGGRSIYNLDESGVTTVQKVPRVISKKGVKQIGQITSQERGELVTMCGIISATGSALPPVFIFPRKNFRDVMMTGAPEGSLGLVVESGWMNSELFVKVMEHVVRHANAANDDPVILTMDNHKSHISLQALEYVKVHGVHVITLPPHTSHKPQPSDRTVFGPMKAFYNAAANSWMMKNPGQNITIYQIAQLAGEAWMKAATPKNIISGFRVSGIWPFDRHVFGEDDFMPSSVTDHLAPNAASRANVVVASTSGTVPVFAPISGTNVAAARTLVQQPVQNMIIAQSSRTDPVVASDPVTDNATHTSGADPLAATSSGTFHVATDSTSDVCSPLRTPTKSAAGDPPSCLPIFISPEQHKGYPKAPERKTTNSGRKKGRTMLATGTPEMKRLKWKINQKKTEKTKKMHCRKSEKNGCHIQRR